MNKRTLICLAGSLALLSACKKEYLSKDEKGALFAAPTPSELDKVREDWQGRDLDPGAYELLQQVDLPAGFRLKIVSFKVNGLKEYGALLLPDAGNPGQCLPVQVYVGGFGLDQASNSVNAVLDSTGAGPKQILAIPALRGQSLALTINGTEYTSPLSEGRHCDAFDKATDDVLAFLNLVQQTETGADVNRTAVRGGSRGGTVALLAGIRDSRVKRVINIVGPADMLTLTAQNQEDPNYQCQFLSAYKSGQITLSEARQTLIASSPFYFSEDLPLTQLHLGLKDAVVPVQQGYALRDKVAGEGHAARFELFTYDRTHTDIAVNNPSFTERIGEFLAGL